MTKSQLILVNGIPGSGKTTLAARLSGDIELPCLHKDMLKECLYEGLESIDTSWSRSLGVASFHMIYGFIDAMLGQGRSIMVECPFYADFARDVISKSVRTHGARCLEIYLDTDPEVWRKRFTSRMTSGSRHSIHTADIEYPDMDIEEVRKRYAPLRIGTLLPVDTTVFEDKEYQQLARKVKQWKAES
jgi:predicted kinase